MEPPAEAAAATKRLRTVVGRMGASLGEAHPQTRKYAEVLRGLVNAHTLDAEQQERLPSPQAGVGRVGLGELHRRRRQCRRVHQRRWGGHGREPG